jgi:hypothetical protein
MDLKATAAQSAQDEREWELSDEELDRAADDGTRGPSCSLCSTSRPCSCARCHCR